MKQFNQKIKPSFPSQHIQVSAKQQGMALIMVLSVLFALTLLGLASTDSSSLQALMVRNNQFRLEAFNRSYNEIEDQLGFYVTDAGKAPLFAVIDNGRQTAQSVYVDTKDTTGEGEGTETVPSPLSPDTLRVLSNSSDFDTTISLSQRADCPIYLNSIGTSKKCSLMQLDSESQYRDTNIGSEQIQQFSFTSF